MIYKKISAVIFVIILSLSCSDRDRENVNKDLDTVKNSLKRDLDTLKKKLLPEDTLFADAKLKAVVIPENVSDELHDNLEEVFRHYIKIKEELYNNDSIDSKKHAMEMLEAVLKAANDAGKKIDKNWNAEGSKMMKYQKLIETSNTLAQQREWFSKLTSTLTEAVLKYGLPGKTVYELETRDSSGRKSSKWLTDSRDSDNPYNGNDENKDPVKVIRGWEFKTN